MLKPDLTFGGYYAEIILKASSAESIDPLLDKMKRDIKKREGCSQKRRNVTTVPLYWCDAALSSFPQRFQKSSLRVPWGRGFCIGWHNKWGKELLTLIWFPGQTLLIQVFWIHQQKVFKFINSPSKVCSKPGCPWATTDEERPCKNMAGVLWDCLCSAFHKHPVPQSRDFWVQWKAT